MIASTNSLTAWYQHPLFLLQSSPINRFKMNPNPRVLCKSLKRSLSQSLSNSIKAKKKTMQIRSLDQLSKNQKRQCFQVTLEHLRIHMRGMNRNLSWLKKSLLTTTNKNWGSKKNHPQYKLDPSPNHPLRRNLTQFSPLRQVEWLRMSVWRKWIVFVVLILTTQSPNSSKRLHSSVSRASNL